MNKIRPAVSGLAVLVLCAGIGLAQRKSNDLSLFKVEEFRARIKFLSDDLLEGRGTGARGGDIASRYIASQFEQLGLKGAGPNGSFMQPVSLVGVKADPKTELSVVGPKGSEHFHFAGEFVAFTGAQKEDVDVNAEMVFVGYGIDAPSQRWNDYKGSPDDYKGKILVMLVNDPPATTAEPALFGGKALTYFGRWTYKYEEAARRGAVGALLLHTRESAGYPWSVVRTSNGSWRFDIARTPEDSTPFLNVRAWMTDDAAHRMMALAGQDLGALRAAAATREFKPIDLGLKGEIHLHSEVKHVNSANVAAIYEGADPSLKDQYVVYSAHWDHLGIGEPNSKGDAIYNGAVDNATGVAAVIGIAEAYTKLSGSEKPRRSILFLIPTAEEQGLLGAEWYTRHPLVPLAKTSANVNLDSLNILGLTRDFVPLGADHSTLKDVSDAVAQDLGMTVSTDSMPEQGSFYRSDHFPFAKVGVPSISLKEGDDFIGHPAGWGKEQFDAYNNANYHQPSDEYSDSWNFDGLLQETNVAFLIGLHAARVPEMQAFRPGDEFAGVKR